MAIASDKTIRYLDMLEDKFNLIKFKEFIGDLLNLDQDDIQNSREYNAGSEQYKHYIDTVQLYAKYQDNKRRNIGILVIKLQSNKNPANARTLQRNYIAHLLDKFELDATLAAIYSETDDTWRLSFVKQEIDFGEGKFKTKFTPAKRYSYLFGKDEPNHTAKEQLLELLENNEIKYSIEEIEEKFSVEKVTKDFFERYKENYLLLKETLESNEEFLSEAKRCDFTSEEFTKKLMGQIVFIYFLQKKGWLGVRLVPQNLTLEQYNTIYQDSDVIQRKILDKYYITFSGNKKIKRDLLERFKENEQELEVLSDIFVDSKYDNEWGTGQKRFIRTIFENCKNRNKNFFDDYLEPFFYNGLNHQRKNQYFSVFNCKIPFLNGGLFEPLDNYQWEVARFNIDNQIFSNEEETGILDFFDRYNFTMNEEEPLEKDVAVDPEMLGKIFENLLDVKDRKSKGAFYTPREIVHYMCQESLANYLVNKVDVNYEEIKDFIQYGEMIRDEDLKGATQTVHLVGDSIFKNIVQIDKALENIKIADPAVGSGAFPLGILNEIVKMRDILTSYVLIYNRLGIFDRQYDEEYIIKSRSIYNIKWNTIKNCIYAVDIENSAVDITKLRLWLSIVVDQIEVPKSGPEPLPNLDCKIMQGNSLIDEFNGIKLIDEKFIEDLKDRDNVILNEGGSCTVKKKKISISANQIEFGDGQKKAQIDSLIDLKKELYGTNDPNRKKQLLQEIQSVRNELLRLNFVGANKEKELFEIDKSHNKPYFAWMLEYIEVFVENDGFDIVIGNPPYVGQKGNKDIFREIEKTDFGKKFNQGKMDLFYYFFHKGLDIGNTNAELLFITTNYYLTAFGGKKLRKDFHDRTQIRNLINFNELKIFETAMGQHNLITILTKYKSKSIKSQNIMCNTKGIATPEIIASIVNKSNKDIEIDNVLQDDLYEGEELYIRPSGINSTEGLSINNILNRLSKCIIHLNDIATIKQGIVSGADKVTQQHIDKYGIKQDKDTGIFILSNVELSLLGNLNEYEKNLIKLVYKNSEIKKYYIDYKNDKHLLYVTKDTDIEQAPKIFNYLKQFKIILEQKRETQEGKLPWYSLHWSREKDFFASNNKIVNSRRANFNTFALAKKDYYEQSDIMVSIIKNEFIKEYPAEYVLGLLNSELYLFWLYNKGKVKGNMLELYGKPLEEIPIINMDIKQKNEIVEYVQELEVCYSEELQEKINAIIYDSCNISNDEIKIIREYIERKQ